MNVVSYFNEKAQRYDEVDSQPYWVFSDKLLWHILKEKFLPKDLAWEGVILDVGCGTARWSKKILDEYSLAKGILLDISPIMLTLAQNKISNSRAQFFLSDAQVINEVSNGTCDCTICFHNVIGFVPKPELVIQRIYEILKPNGIAAIMFPSYYHAIYFSNTTNRTNQYENIKNNKICYNDQMPPLTIFKFEEIETLLDNVGFKTWRHYGFPVTFYPGMEETYISGTSRKIINLFAQKTAIDELCKELGSKLPSFIRV